MTRLEAAALVLRRFGPRYRGRRVVSVSFDWPIATITLDDGTDVIVAGRLAEALAAPRT